jgi:putative hemolysin
MPSAVPLAPFPWFDVLIVVFLMVVNAAFAMSELAIVSARKPRGWRAMARRGGKGARIAIDLAADPGKFLSTVQIGITLTAVLAGAFSGAALGEPVGAAPELLGMNRGGRHAGVSAW